VSGQGGYTAAERARAAGSHRTPPQVRLTLKVPVAAYPAALAHLAGLGHQAALSQQSRDVTQQVADVSSRVTSEQAAITQLRALLKRAGNVSGLLQVQQQIAGDTSNLEALQAQQRALDHETSYATITAVLLGPRAAPVVRHRHAHGGFVGGLDSGWHGLRAATAWVLHGLGVILPFLLLVVLLGGLGWAWRRRIRRRGELPASG
jgi:hypothetical protein